MSENQARHLDECLSSVHAQAGVRPEVVVVPWGHWAGGTAALAGSASPEESLAAARRAGLALTRAPHVRFVEAGDTVPAPATRALLAALETSSAPSAAGISERIDATWRDRAHQVPPEVAFDLGARLLAVSEEVLEALHFEPVHGRCADALLAGLDGLGAPAVVLEVVHHDHHREHGLSFGHLPRRAAEVRALAAVAEDTLDRLPAGTAPAWAAGLLDRRLPPLVEDVESFDDETWDTLCRTARLLRDLADPALVRVESRLQTWLTAEGRREELTGLVLRRWRDADDVPTRVAHGGRVLADLGVEAPDEVLVLHARETPLWSSLRRSRVEDDIWTAELVVLARGVPSSPDDRLTARFVAEGSALVEPGEVTVPATAFADPYADRVAAESHTDHTHAGWRLAVPAAVLPAAPHRLELELHCGEVVRVGDVTHRDELGSAGHLGLTSAGSRLRPQWVSGALAVDTVAEGPDAGHAGGPLLTGFSVDGPLLTLRLDGLFSGRVVLTGPGGRVAGEPATTGDDGAVVVRLEVDAWGLGERPLPLGRYAVRLLGPDGEVAVGLAPELLAASPVEVSGLLHRLTLRPDRHGGAMVVLEDRRGPAEVGPGAQRRLQQEYAAVTERVDPGLAYFQSYTGQWPTDSPLAVHHSLRRQRPDLRILWGIDDPGLPVPEGADPVLLRSREWYDALAGAGWIVTNIEMERWFRRRPGQHLLQTWHGNPGKVMGLGLWRANGLTPGRIEQNLDHGPRTWTLLMSPSPEMTGHYRREFAYTGPVVDQGYARDDELLSRAAPGIRAETRRRLGVGDDQVAVLYAPTWRDTLATNYRAARLQDDLDVARLAGSLGPSHVVLLRGHRFHARHPERPRGARILDVTDYPEINHLVLAADVAVLDYSSLRFDVGVIGTPMLFLVPDLAAYERERGFLYDFRSSAPGPLLATTDEVVAALRDLEGVRHRHAADYAEFRARFHAGQDGHAADRAVAAFFGPASVV